MNVTSAPTSAGTGVVAAAPAGPSGATPGFAALLLGELAGTALPGAAVPVAAQPGPVPPAPPAATTPEVAATAPGEVDPETPGLPSDSDDDVAEPAADTGAVPGTDALAPAAAPLLPLQPALLQAVVVATPTVVPGEVADPVVDAAAPTGAAPVGTPVAAPAPTATTALTTVPAVPGGDAAPSPALPVPGADLPVAADPRASGDAPDSSRQDAAADTTAAPAATAASNQTTPGATLTAAVTATVQASAPSVPGAVALPVTRDPVTAQVLPVVARAVSQGEGVHRLVLRLHPLDLGEVRVTMTVRDGSVDVVLTAGAQARHHLSQGSSELRQMLETVGATAGQIVVKELVPTGAPATPAPPAATGSGLGAAADQGGGLTGHAGPGSERSPDRGRQTGPGLAGSSGAPEPPVPRRTAPTSTRSLDLTL